MARMRATAWKSDPLRVCQRKCSESGKISLPGPPQPIPATHASYESKGTSMAANSGRPSLSSGWFETADQYEEGDRDDTDEGSEITKGTILGGWQPRAVLRRRTR
jgi:hypothetical protein